MGRASADAGLIDRRFHVPGLDGQAEAFALDAEAAKHVRVLRLSEGAEVELFDGRGGKRPARLEKRAGALWALATGALVQTPRTQALHLVLCLPKGGKLDDIVRACGELGVAAVHPALSERSVPRPKGANRLDRVARIAVEAARQSEQPWVTEVHPPRALAEVLADAPPDAVRLALTERGGDPLAVASGTPEVWVVVGPEGGLGPADRELLGASGFASVGLGRAILRVETAAVVGVSLVLDRMGLLAPEPAPHITPDGDAANR